MKIILIIILCACVYVAGELQGKKDTLITIKQYIEDAKDWNNFLQRFSRLWKNEIGD